jgi:molybdopterin/thiamine biosynthesis adenylyltransferase
MDEQQYTVIGGGGTASHLIPVLARSIGPQDVIHVWDGDHVETGNLGRQMFAPTDIGKPKATVWAERFPDVVKDHPAWVGAVDIDRVVQERDIVLICADNMTVRRIVAEHAETLSNVTVINGGNEQHSGSVQVHIRRDGTNLTPPITYHSPEIMSTDPDRSLLSCAQLARLPSGDQTVLANMTVATLMLHALIRAREVFPISVDKQWTKVTFDIISGIWQPSDFRLHGEDWR